MFHFLACKSEISWLCGHHLNANPAHGAEGFEQLDILLCHRHGVPRIALSFLIIASFFCKFIRLNSIQCIYIYIICTVHIYIYTCFSYYFPTHLNDIPLLYHYLVLSRRGPNVDPAGRGLDSLAAVEFANAISKDFAGLQKLGHRPGEGGPDQVHYIHI